MAKYTVEESLTIDVTQMNKSVVKQMQGLPVFATMGISGAALVSISGICLLIDDDKSHSINFTVSVYSKTYSHRYEERIWLTKTEIPYGAKRWWFKCPKCGHRRSKLHFAPEGEQFLCRECNNLTYRSCQESRRWDALYKLMAKKWGVDFKTAKHTMEHMEL